MCNADEQQYDALCYPYCAGGYENIGPNICWKIGCGGLPGYVDVGISCSKPPAYGRGAGYVIWEHDRCVRENGVDCEQSGWLWYPRCKPNFNQFGCCLCSPICPNGYNDVGAFCFKPNYGRGVGVSRLGCAAGLQYDAGLCYTPCTGGRVGVGPLCWSKCGGVNWFECGLFCTSSEAKCAGISLKIVGSAVVVLANVVGKDPGGAIEAFIDAGKEIAEPHSC